VIFCALITKLAGITNVNKITPSVSTNAYVFIVLSPSEYALVQDNWIQTKAKSRPIAAGEVNRR
jgi:hypothetical protein